MTAVFLHGVPETYRIWDGIRARLGEMPSVSVALPGFGSPLPNGFSATKDAYIDWIIAELEKQPHPVDLVGHDWGSLFTLRIASVRPDLIRSWSGGGATIRAVKVWHALAHIWQTEGEGEDWMAKADLDALTARFIENGVGPCSARAMANHVDATMKACILNLYRSAVDVGYSWEPDLARIKAPGLMIWGDQDPMSRSASLEDQEADAAMAPAVRLEGCGHWWPLQKAADAADALLGHWKQCD